MERKSHSGYLTGMEPEPNLDRDHLTNEFVLHLTDSQPKLFGFLIKRLGRHDQASEVLQNVNLTICQKAKEFVPGTDFMAWAYTIAKFQVMAFRQNQYRDKLVFSPDLVAALESLDEALMDNDQLAKRKEALARCLSKLSGEKRELIKGRYAESLSIKALAGELGRTDNSVSVLLHRIREQLLVCIKQELSRSNDG